MNAIINEILAIMDKRRCVLQHMKTLPEWSLAHSFMKTMAIAEIDQKLLSLYHDSLIPLCSSCQADYMNPFVSDVMNEPTLREIFYK